MADQTIQAADGSGNFNAYVALPRTGKGPGIVIIQEIFGVNPWLRQIADRAAAHGYVAMAPDLFWRLKPSIQLDPDIEKEFQEGLGYMQRFDQDKAVEDLQATLDALRQNSSCTGKVGTVGYCLGGRLAFMMACRSDADANVSYYGVNIPPLLGEAKNITKPLLMHIAENDKFVPPPAQQQIKDGLKGNSQVTIYTYPGADHGFARNASHSFHKESAELANSRSNEFFRRTLWD
jgi:carboxymethylenebutenolidase